MSNNNDDYPSGELRYRIALQEGGKYSIACLDYYDRLNCAEHRFLKDKEGKMYECNTRNKARRVLNDLIKPELIEPDDLMAGHKDHFK